MRRKDKEISDPQEIKSIIDNASVCRIALCDENKPYVVPVHFGFDHNSLYIHSAPEGKKIDILKKNNNVCVEIDLDHKVEVGKVVCSSGTKYKSVIASGKAIFIEDIEEKKKGLNIILNHYSKRNNHNFRDKQINRVLIIKIELNEITGKKSGYE